MSLQILLELGNGSVQLGCDSCNVSLRDVTRLPPTDGHLGREPS